MDMNSLDDDIIIHPVKTRKDSRLPEVGILFVNPGEAKAAVEHVIDRGGKRLFLHNSKLALTGDGQKFVAGPSVGAPFAALIVEKLIALGAKRLVQMGWCGAVSPRLKVGDIIIPDGAVSGEGTSQYYQSEKVEPGIAPSPVLCRTLSAVLMRAELTCRTGKIWSTDAPYRESRKQLQLLMQDDGVVGVDMEFSALCSVASFRGIEFSSVMVVSDELMGERWRPGFKNPVFRENCNKVLQTLVNERV